LVTGDPLTLKSELGALSPTLLTVPKPGKVWLGANVNTPVLLSLKPVSLGAPEPDANNKFRLPLGLDVLLPLGSACQRKFCDTAVPVVLLKADAVSVLGCEFFPPLAVAVPVAGKLRLPRTVALPFTSSVLAGVLVLMPIFAVLPDPDWNKTELPRVFPSGVHSGTKSRVPLPARLGSTRFAAVLELLGAVVPEDKLGGAASTKAEAGSPPIVCASAAFNA
jgi:hypothetical protein